MRHSWFFSSLLALTALGSFLLFYNLDAPSFHPGDERIHVEATLSMWFSGRWWMPEYEGKPYFNKPPLKMWLTFVPLWLLGISNFSFRLIDAFAGLGTLLLTFCVAWRLLGGGGLIAGLSLIASSNYLFYHCARSAVQDSFLVLCLTAALFLTSLIIGLDGRERSETERRRYALYVGWLVGCGALVKSVGAFVFFPIVIVYLVLTRSWKLFNLPIILRVAIPAAILPALYYCPHFLFSPEAFQVSVHHELIDRARQGYHHADEQLYYLDRIISQRRAAPPELLAWGLIWAAILLWKNRSKTALFLVIWATVPVLIYSFYPSRQFWYIYPAFPAMALLIAQSLLPAVKIITNYNLYRRSFTVTNGFRYLGSIMLLVGALLLLAEPLKINMQEVFEPNKRGFVQRRRTFDRLVTDVAEYARENQIKFVIWDTLPPQDFDKPYLKMLDQAVFIPPSEDELREAINNGKDVFVLTTPEAIDSVRSMGIVTNYAAVPPQWDGERWRWLVSFSKDFHSPLFLPAQISLATADCKEASVELLIEGQIAYKRFGADLIFLQNDSAQIVEVKFNDKLLLPAITDAQAVFSLDPQLWSKERNKLSVHFSSCPTSQQLLSLKVKES